MDESTVSMFVAFAAGVVAVVGGFTIITSMVVGATTTIHVVGYAVGVLLIFEGLTYFLPNYARLD